MGRPNLSKLQIPCFTSAVYSVANNDDFRKALDTPDILIMCWKTVTLPSAHATNNQVEQVEVPFCNLLYTYGAANVRPRNTRQSTLHRVQKGPVTNVTSIEFGKYSVVFTAEWSKKGRSDKPSS